MPDVRAQIHMDSEDGKRGLCQTIGLRFIRRVKTVYKNGLRRTTDLRSKWIVKTVKGGCAKRQSSEPEG